MSDAKAATRYSRLDGGQRLAVRETAPTHRHPPGPAYGRSRPFSLIFGRSCSSRKRCARCAINELAQRVRMTVRSAESAASRASRTAGGRRGSEARNVAHHHAFFRGGGAGVTPRGGATFAAARDRQLARFDRRQDRHEARLADSRATSVSSWRMTNRLTMFRARARSPAIHLRKRSRTLPRSGRPDGYSAASIRDEEVVSFRISSRRSRRAARRPRPPSAGNRDPAEFTAHQHLFEVAVGAVTTRTSTLIFFCCPAS